MTDARFVVVLLGCMVACESSSPRRGPVYPPAPYPGYPPPGPPQSAPIDPKPPPRSNQDISRVINAASPSFTACYQHSESYMTAKSGTVTIFFDVAPAGNVLRATDQAPPGIAPQPGPLHDARLTECLVRGFYGLKFPVARDETAASWTFSFGT